MAIYEPNKYFSSTTNSNHWNDPEVEDLRRRLMGSALEDRASDLLKKLDEPHFHNEYTTWSELNDLRTELLSLKDLVTDLQMGLAHNPCPDNPAYRNDPSLGDQCSAHAQGRHLGPYAHQHVCPMCWEAIHHKCGGEHVVER